MVVTKRDTSSFLMEDFALKSDTKAVTKPPLPNMIPRIPVQSIVVRL